MGVAIGLIDTIFEEAIYDRYNGEVIAIRDYPQVNIIRGEVLFTSGGFVAPSIKDDFVFTEATFAIWRICRMYGHLPADGETAECHVPLTSLPKHDGIRCPKCGSINISYQGWVKRQGRDKSNPKRYYQCRLCKRYFVDNRFRSLRMKFEKKIVDFVVAYSESHSYEQTIAELKKQFSITISDRTVMDWRQKAGKPKLKRRTFT
jgi:transposase-like protein